VSEAERGVAEGLCEGEPRQRDLQERVILRVEVSSRRRRRTRLAWKGGKGGIPEKYWLGVRQEYGIERRLRQRERFDTEALGGVKGHCSKERGG